MRLFSDALVLLFGLIVALSMRGASAARLACAPLFALPMTAGAVGSWWFVTVVLPTIPRLLGPVRTSFVELGLCLLGGILAGVGTPRPAGSNGVLRGARIVDPDPVRFRRRRTATLLLAGVPVPRDDETKHFKIIGTTGTGKTTAIKALLGGALRRGDRAVIADPDGSYRRAFEHERGGDLLLNPLEPESCGWDLFGEIEVASDADLLARALIPEAGTDDRAWRAYARLFVASLLRQLVHAGHRDVATLHRLVSYAAVEELQELLAGTAAAAYVSPDNGRFLASVRAIASSDLAVLEPLACQRVKRRLSVRSWARAAAPGGSERVLYLPYRSGQLATLRGLVATWLRLAIYEALDGHEDAQALWFVVDELDALGVIDGLKDALARLRKYGGRCVLGVQSISQLSGTYGAPAAQTIIENCGNTLLLRCSAGEHGGTARFGSMLIGDREVLRLQISRTRPFAFNRGERTRSETVQRHVERAVLPAELEQLPDLHGYVKLASSPDWRRVVVPR